MRWKRLLGGLALVCAATIGCEKQCFLTEPDHDAYIKQLGLPCKLESDPTVAVVPSGLDIPEPADVNNAERPPRYLTLAECVALALEQGKTGITNPRLGGTIDDTLSAFQGRVVSLSDGIRVLALEPAALAADIEASLSKFDAHWTSSMTWRQTDEPTGGNTQQSFQNGESADLNTTLVKPLPTGGTAGITFDTTYTFLTNPPVSPGSTFTNPAYRPRLQFNFEQPLLQGYGVEINQLRAQHPGSLLTPFSTGGRVEGVLITRIRFDQARSDFMRNLNYMLLNVETAYWNLYGSYYDLYSREQGLRQAYEAWRINRERLDVGKITRQDLAQTREQYELFRGQRIASLGTVLENERQLRGLLGLPIEDGTRLVPVDAPTMSFYRPDWSTALNEALVSRPELISARQDLKFRQLDLINTKNLLLPDLRFDSTYNLNGLGSHLDGGPGDPQNALHSLASNQFQDWSLGLRLDMPLGFRDAHSATRVAKLRLAQSYLSLRDMELRTQSFLGFSYRQLAEQYEQIRAQRAQREAAGIALESRLKEYLAGKIILDILLRAQQDFADALRAEFAAIAAYNTGLARFEFAKGTLAQHDNVVVMEGPLPQCAQVRAVDHERERSVGLVMRERARPVPHGSCCYERGNAGLPELPALRAPSIPSLYEGMRESKEAGQKERTETARKGVTMWERMPPLSSPSAAPHPDDMPGESAISPAGGRETSSDSAGRVERLPVIDPHARESGESTEGSVSSPLPRATPGAVRTPAVGLRDDGSSRPQLIWEGGKGP